MMAYKPCSFNHRKVGLTWLGLLTRKIEVTKKRTDKNATRTMQPNDS